jgi:hypothetical protein
VIIRGPVYIEKMVKAQIQQGVKDRGSVEGAAQGPVDIYEAAVSQPGAHIAGVKNTHDIAQGKEKCDANKENDSGRRGTASVGIPGDTVAEHQDEAGQKKEGLVETTVSGAVFCRID